MHALKIVANQWQHLDYKRLRQAAKSAVHDEFGA
jgi:hypothetical protein